MKWYSIQKKKKRNPSVSHPKVETERAGDGRMLDVAAKNNLVLARAAQRKYDLPVINMSQTERSQLYYTAGLAAVKQGDIRTGKQLLQQAIDTNPQYFEAAQRSLAALQG